MRSDPSLVKKLTKLTHPWFAILALSLSGCGQGAEDVAFPQPKAGAIGSYAGEGRDRLCLKDGEPEGGLITFAATGDSNCSLRFATRYAEGSTASGTLATANDPSCTIPFSREEGRLTLGTPAPGCAYYCGPGAALEGKSFVRMDKNEPVTDLAGDPLC
jgi:hypothetical protein